MAVEMWTTGIAHVAYAPRAAVRAEEAGWDGMVVVDSQNLSGDPVRRARPGWSRDLLAAARHRRDEPGDAPPGGHRGGHRQRARRVGRPGRARCRAG